MRPAWVQKIVEAWHREFPPVVCHEPDEGEWERLEPVPFTVGWRIRRDRLPRATLVRSRRSWRRWLCLLLMHDAEYDVTWGRLTDCRRCGR